MAYPKTWPCYLCTWSSNDVTEFLEHLRDDHKKSDIADAMEKIKDQQREEQEMTFRGEEIPLRRLLIWQVQPTSITHATEKSQEIYRANLRRHYREGISLEWENARKEPHRPSLVWQGCRATIGANTDDKPFIIYQYIEDRKDEQSVRTGATPIQYAETIQEAKRIAEEFITGRMEHSMRGENPKMPRIEFAGFANVERRWTDRR